MIDISDKVEINNDELAYLNELAEKSINGNGVPTQIKEIKTEYITNDANVKLSSADIDEFVKKYPPKVDEINRIASLEIDD